MTTTAIRASGYQPNGWFLLVTGWGNALLITAIDVYGLPDSLRAARRVIAGG